MIVALPIGVRPMIVTEVGSNLKWRIQLSLRGLNSRYTFCETGSTAAVATPLKRLQDRQVRARLLSDVSRFRDKGKMCSTSNGKLNDCSGARQYSHRRPARLATNAYLELTILGNAPYRPLVYQKPSTRGPLALQVLPALGSIDFLPCLGLCANGPSDP
jgi:hypothetical protein